MQTSYGAKLNKNKRVVNLDVIRAGRCIPKFEVFIYSWMGLSLVLLIQCEKTFTTKNLRTLFQRGDINVTINNSKCCYKSIIIIIKFCKVCLRGKPQKENKNSKS